MNDVLLLTHRIPWPPDKGDKIRSYHFFRHLAEKYRLHLGTFIDSADDWRHVPELEKRCASVCVRPTGRFRSVRRGLRALSQGKSVTMVYYDDKVMSRWVADLVSESGLTAAIVYSAGMAGYLDAVPPSMPKVLDMVDVDSEKWLEYAAHKSLPQSWVYRREARLLSRAEIDLVSRFDRTLLVSDDEVRLLRNRCPDLQDRISVVPNGVDSDYFSPGDFALPFPETTDAIVFTGAMDYWANVEGVSWFAHEVFPQIRAQAGNTSFYIVGSKPSAEVRALADLPGVFVTGRVPDVRPYLAHAKVVVAPLRIARGLQNKVLEGMAMARPVVATTAAMRGIDCKNSGIQIADTPALYSQAVLDRIEGAAAPANRHFVVEHFSWRAAVARLQEAMGDKEKIKEGMLCLKA